MQSPSGDGGGSPPGEGEGRPSPTQDHEPPQFVHMKEGNGPEAAEPAQGFPDCHLGQPGRDTLQNGDIKGCTFNRRRGGSIKELGGDVAEGRVFLGESPGRSTKSLGDTGVESLLKEGNQFEANPVADEVGIRVGRIGPVRQAVGAQVSQDVRSAGLEEGPEQFPVPRLHGGQAERAAPPHQAHQDGLRLIIQSVTQDHRDRVLFPSDPTEKRISHEASGLLETAVAQGSWAGPGAARSQPHLQEVTQLLAELGVGAGVAAQGMIEMGGHHVQPRLPTRAKKRIQEGD